MAGKGKAGVASGVVIGGFLLLGIVLLAIAAMIILSLISIYTPNRSSQPSGSIYEVNGAMLKTLFGDSNATLASSVVAENTALSSACAVAARAAGGITSFAGCVLTGLRASNANTSNTSRRRRATENGAYLFGTARMYFSSICEKSSDRNLYSNSSSISSCTRSRLNMCNGAFGTSSAFNQWQGLASGSTIAFVDSSSSTYVTRSLFRAFGIPPSVARSIAAALGFATADIARAGNGCFFSRTATQSEIAAALAAQSTATTTQPTTTNVATG